MSAKLTTGENGVESYHIRGEVKNVHYLLTIDKELLQKPEELIKSIDVEINMLMSDFANELLSNTNTTRPKVDE